jgi:hypothetical protein
MPLKEFTELLVADMIGTLNARTKREEKQRRGKQGKR